MSSSQAVRIAAAELYRELPTTTRTQATGEPVEKNYCTRDRGRSITITDQSIPAFWYVKGSPYQVNGNLGRGVWIVDSIGECGPGGEFYVVYQNSPVFRMAYVYVNDGRALLA